MKLANPIRYLAALCMAALLFALGTSTTVVAADDRDGMQDWAKHRQEWIKDRLDKTADRLEIKASQQNAWQAYAKAIEGLTGMTGKHPGDDADAAAMAKFHADMAGEFAKKLRQISEATAKLQAVLTPEQRKTLDQIAREAGHGEWMHHAHGDDLGRMGGHGGPDEHDHCERHDGHEGHQSQMPPPPPAKP